MSNSIYSLKTMLSNINGDLDRIGIPKHENNAVYRVSLLCQEVELLRKVVTFYGDPETWMPFLAPYSEETRAGVDRGSIARAVMVEVVKSRGVDKSNVE